MIDNETLANIEKLYQMKADGIISPEEFTSAKTQLLTSQPPSSQIAEGTTQTSALPAADDYLGWAVLPLKRYAQFHGRSSRKEFWLFLLLLNLGSVAFVLLGIVLSFPIALALWAVAFLAILLPYVAVQARRFHDQGKSGWLTLLNLIPYIGPIVALIFMALPGTFDRNRFGEDPLFS